MANADRTLLTQVAELSRRSVVRTLRQPSQIFPSIVFPLILLAINSGGLDSVTDLPGFPSDSYLTFALGVVFIQAGIFSVGGAGADLARDIETGFFDRLALTPMSGIALIAGHLAGTVALGAIQGVVFITVGLIAGAGLEAGPAGALIILALTMLIALMFGAIGVFAAFRFGTAEAVQGLFPVLFVFLFLSSMYLPRPLIEQDWFRAIATANPVSYLIEGIRSLLVDGFDFEALTLAFGCGAAIAALFLALAVVAMRTRLVRT
jgi:ABC-2 type transport system permease protein